MSAVRDFPKIKAVRSFVIGGVGSGTFPWIVPGMTGETSGHHPASYLTEPSSNADYTGGDYHNVEGGHW